MIFLEFKLLLIKIPNVYSLPKIKLYIWRLFSDEQKYFYKHMIMAFPNGTDATFTRFLLCQKHERNRKMSICICSFGSAGRLRECIRSGEAWRRWSHDNGWGKGSSYLHCILKIHLKPKFIKLSPYNFQQDHDPKHRIIILICI